MAKLFYKNKNYMELSPLILQTYFLIIIFQTSMKMHLVQGVIPVYLNLCELLLPRVSTKLREY